MCDRLEGCHHLLDRDICLVRSHLLVETGRCRGDGAGAGAGAGKLDWRRNRGALGVTGTGTAVPTGSLAPEPYRHRHFSGAGTVFYQQYLESASMTKPTS